MKYSATHGGHTPGHLREAFLSCFDGQASDVWYEPLGEEETLELFDPKKQEAWDAMDLKGRARWITGQLWNCTDILPHMICADLDIPPGSTYARAVRNLRAELG